MAQMTLMLWLLLIPVLVYFFILIFITRNLSGIEPYRTQDSGLKAQGKRVAVVIACRNEENSIPYLLSDIISQDHPQELTQVIIVDDWSWDGTAAIASAYGQIKNLKVLKNSGRGKKNAIQTGIEAADCDLIITTDADCRFGRKWISTIVSFYEEKKPQMIIGPVIISGNRGFFHRFQELEFMSLQAITAGTAVAGDPVMCNGANLAFSKESWLKHSSALRDDIQSGDDIFFLHSLKSENDAKIWWLESMDAIVRTSPSETVLSFLKQRARWISKSSAYDDRYTKILSIVTFVTILELLILLVAGFIDPAFFRIFLAGFLFKSVADLVILAEITRRRKREDLLLWFLPSQIVYPFYVVAVSVYSLFRKNKW
jgi:cellulose synthase/poly-beta-1,6-N-acetylglucosamine synthase-like glycosyltransferase